MTIRKDTWYPDLEGLYTGTKEDLSIEFSRMQDTLEPYINDFVREISFLEKEGFVVTPEILITLASFQRLINAVRGEVNTFALYAGDRMDVLMGSATSLGEKAALDLALSNLGRINPQLFLESWNRPSLSAVERFIAYIDDAAMQAEFRIYGEQVAERFSELLIGGIRTGTNPTQLAEQAVRLLNLPFVWADNISRTTSLYSYRMAAHAAYFENSNLLEGWYWISALDDRTCMSCIDKHGQLFSVDQVLNDHHRGRCVPVPAVIGSGIEDNIVLGRDWFTSLSSDRQRAIMGDPLYSAYKAGEIGWGEFSAQYHNPTFGDMLTEVTVLSKLGEDGAKYY